MLQPSSLLDLLVVIVAACAIALGALASFPIPGTDIPQTAQTIAVLLCGALLGARKAGAAVGMYLLAGMLGLPVYSDGASGLSAFLGGSLGYFIGFFLAALVCGWAVSRLANGRVSGDSKENTVARAKMILLLAITFLAGHAIILVLGGLRMALNSGWESAYYNGIAPFYYGSVVKSLLCTLLCFPLVKLRRSHKVD